VPTLPRAPGRSGAGFAAGYVSGTAPAEITGSAFETVGLGCAALCVAGIALVMALTRAEAAVAQPAPAPGSGENASSASSRETAPVMAATTSSASG
jgi:hypothetical protein